MNVTVKQKEMLLNYLKLNYLKRKSELVRGRIDRKNESQLKLVKIFYYIMYYSNC